MSKKITLMDKVRTPIGTTGYVSAFGLNGAGETMVKVYTTVVPEWFRESELEII